ncbi:DUF1707 SHOCT-like domain-containing protein [Nocardioides sp. MAHUQ-72]|uniref:DUF1707 SHOCT-like domain-containing protein n=1 Tax=unclassified Nocardioides TaxID=2615069 RepID=UPI00361C8024
MNDQHLRLSDAERELAATELGEHYVSGRLTPEEHGERLDRIWAARTRGELLPVFADLPSRYAARPVVPTPGPRGPTPWSGGHASRWHRGVPAPVFVVLAILLVITVVTHLPVIVIGLLAWFFLAHRFRRSHYPRRW